MGSQTEAHFFLTIFDVFVSCMTKGAIKAWTTYSIQATCTKGNFLCSVHIRLPVFSVVVTKLIISTGR